MLFSATGRLFPQSHEGSKPGVATRAVRGAVSVLGRAGRAAWHGLEELGQVRASRELLLLADRWSSSDPELARQLREASRFEDGSAEHPPEAASRPAARPERGQP